MKKKSLLAVCALGLMLAMSGAPAHAQDMGKFTLFGGYSYQVNSLGGGNSFEPPLCFVIDSPACIFEQGAGLHGYTGSVVYNAGNHVGIEADFAGHNGTPTVLNENASSTNNGERLKARIDDYTYTFGPNIHQAIGNFSIFTHFLAGAAHAHDGFTAECLQSSGGSTCSPNEGGSARGNGFAFRTGGGLDWKHGRLGWRMIQVDYVHESLWVTGMCDTCSQPASIRLTAGNIEVATGVTLSFGRHK